MIVEGQCCATGRTRSVECVSSQGRADWEHVERHQSTCGSDDLGVEGHMNIIRRANLWRERIVVESDVLEIFHAGRPAMVLKCIPGHDDIVVHRTDFCEIDQAQGCSRANRTRRRLHDGIVEQVVGDRDRACAAVETAKLRTTTIK